MAVFGGLSCDSVVWVWVVVPDMLDDVEIGKQRSGNVRREAHRSAVAKVSWYSSNHLCNIYIGLRTRSIARQKQLRGSRSIEILGSVLISEDICLPSQATRRLPFRETIRYDRWITRRIWRRRLQFCSYPQRPIKHACLN